MPVTGVYTVGEICTEALREVNVAALDVPATAAEMAIAIKRLNMMMKGWQNSGITVWKETSASISITAATASYSIATRPLRFHTVNFKANGIETPLTEMTRLEYMELPDKTSAGSPSSYYYHKGRDAGTLYVWPVQADAANTIEWYGTAEIEDITATSDTLDAPSEWYEAIVYNLAKRLLGAFPTVGEARTGQILLMAQESLDAALGADVDGSMMLEPEY